MLGGRSIGIGAMVGWASADEPPLEPARSGSRPADAMTGGVFGTFVAPADIARSRDLRARSFQASAAGVRPSRHGRARDAAPVAQDPILGVPVESSSVNVIKGDFP